MASAIFAITNAVPGADVGRAVQRIDSLAGSLISEVDLTVWPGVSGTVLTASSLQGTGDVLTVTVDSTRVVNSNVLPFFDKVAVPVRELIERLRGLGSTTVRTHVLFLDDDLRVMRTEDSEIFVYRRL